MKLVFLLLKLILKLLYRVEVKGLENYEKAGQRVVIMPNHLSFLDPPLLAAFLPEKPSFAINTLIAQMGIVKLVLPLFKIFRLDPTNPMSAKSLIDFVEKDNKVVIFPEGRITVTGSLMKVYEGPGMVAEKSGATILPIHIEGAQYTKFSRIKGKVRQRWFPKITITILPPFKPESKTTGKNRRADMANRLERMMSEAQFAATNTHRSIAEAVIESAGIHGRKHVIAEGIERKPMSYGDLFIKTAALSPALSKHLKGHYIGVLLPNAIANVVTFFALHENGKVPAMLNFSAGATNINNAIKTADIQTIITSRMFIKKGGLEELLEQIKGNAEIVYLEDVGKEITKLDKVKALIKSRCPKSVFAKSIATDSETPAVILFTSGSEGVPKGVALSHHNILANIAQARAVIDLSSRDVLLNILPMFHSFGLTVGTILPLITGVKTFLYPSPLHYNIVPEIAYAIKATIICGTDTFLARYGAAAHPYDFFSMRYVIAGAEKLKPSTRQLWFEKFGIRIMEGYGVTETSPFLSVNTPMFTKFGSVGKIVPGVEYDVRKVEGIAEGGELWVKGENIMLGYIRLEKPGVIQPPKDGWYGTGDIVAIDEEGYVSIQGRAKRFAKVAGEMVSLPLVEEFAGKLWPGAAVAVVAVKDDKKGEQLVLVVPDKNHGLAEFKEFAKKNGLADIASPRKSVVAEIPLLGSGKIDYPKLQKLVDEQHALEKDFGVEG